MDGVETHDVSDYPDSLFIAVAGDGDPATEALAVTANRSVPTLGEWGMIAFMAMLAVAGLVVVRRQRLA